MKGKIMMMALLCALLVGLVPLSSAKAEEVATYADLNDYLGKRGRNFPAFDLKDGASYMFLYKNHSNASGDLPAGYYVVEVLDDTKENYFYSSIYMKFKKTVNFYFIGYALNTDYSSFSWGCTKTVENTSYIELTRYSDSYFTVYYTDKIIYEDYEFNEVRCYSSKPLKEVPSVPSAIKEQAESYIVGRMSPLRKAYACEPFMLVSSGQPFLRTSDRCIAFVDNDLSYAADVELWLVDDNGEWYLSDTSLNAYCGSDVAGVALEYAPEVIYTNKTIYLQDETSAEIALSSEVYANINTGDSDAKEVITSGFPRLFEVSDTLAYLYREPTTSSTLLYALHNGKGGTAESVAYDDSGTAWYKVSVMYNGYEQVGYLKYDVVEIGSTVLIAGGSDSGDTGIGGSVGYDVYIYKPALSGKVDADSVNMRELPSVESNAVGAFIKTWSVSVQGYCYDSDGVIWYLCTTERDDVTYTGYMQAKYIKVETYGGIDVNFEGIDIEDVPVVLKASIDSLLSALDLVSVVPLMMGAVFGFLPSWCLLMVGASFVLICIVGIVKVFRG